MLLFGDLKSGCYHASKMEVARRNKPAGASKSLLASGHKDKPQASYRSLKSLSAIEITIANSTPSEGNILKHGTYADDVQFGFDF